MKQCNGAYTIVDQSDAFALFVFGPSKPRNYDRNTARKHGHTNSGQRLKGEMQKGLIYKSFMFIFNAGSGQKPKHQQFQPYPAVHLFPWILRKKKNLMLHLFPLVGSDELMRPELL